ncbi:MgtC/SapB family protein [Halanaerobium praevalens]|jgi:putative Mg2+ transporter-C (MgtC) family protein|uniref:MgtC/SapB transporter n=1 Tax=Halanaerobium praevalens (strain ATCC 33744 / DSM 2228 / GSL) TaxID=572479 RepID=E3DLL7_HALPG|nr:MgtC/SapB family protein [Halanaerobium praevalens]ADO76197.1 MgtC/SapB transporter [Halanaerobium praevalens DSM 2228]
MVSEKNIIINLILALFLSGLIGFEREQHDRPAGLRTHVLVGTGATIIMMISLAMHNIHVENDAGRIAAQVVSGVGFLGAGTIIKEGFSVKGLTTAASLWATAAIGLAIGGNFYFLAVLTTLFVIVSLYLLNSIEFNKNSNKYRRLKFRLKNENEILSKISNILNTDQLRIRGMQIKRDFRKLSESENEIIVKYKLESGDKEKLLQAANKLLENEEIIELDISD